MDELIISLHDPSANGTGVSLVARSKDFFRAFNESGVLDNPGVEVIIDSSEPIIVRGCKAKILVRGNSKVFAMGNARIEATGNSTVEIKDAAEVVADISVKVIPAGIATAVRSGNKVTYTHIRV